MTTSSYSQPFYVPSASAAATPSSSLPLASAAAAVAAAQTVAQTSDLWLKIDQLHLNYLKAEESPKKMDMGKKLEGYIHQYLCLVPQERKFCSPLTSEIVFDSALHVPNFSASKAVQAFGALELYAANLLNQPWRKEFKEIKQYGGYYTQNISSALKGAERMFYQMGYKSSGQDSLVLDGPVDQDKVTTVARDCILALVECKIVLNIVQCVSSQHPCSWNEVFCFRRDHVGTPEQALRSILYAKNQQQYQTSLLGQGYLPSGEHQLAQLYGYLSYPAPVVYTPVNTQPVHHPPPTAKLIDVGDSTSSSSSATAAIAARRTPTPPQQQQQQSQIPLTIKHLEEENRRKSLLPAGAAAAIVNGEDSWDYVYRQLERIGYTKDQSERPDVLALLSKVSMARQQQQQQQQRQAVFPLEAATADEELLLKHLQEARLDSKKAVRSEDETDAVHHRFRNGGASGDVDVDDVHKRRSLRYSRPLEPPKIPSAIPTAVPPSTGVVPPRWECYACTYANTLRVDICEMCGKSRISPESGAAAAAAATMAGGATSGEESGSAAEDAEEEGGEGGVACHKCTLVNPGRRKVCDACGATLSRRRDKRIA